MRKKGAEAEVGYGSLSSKGRQFTLDIFLGFCSSLKKLWDVVCGGYSEHCLKHLQG
jgi:hypothetical protein